MSFPMVDDLHLMAGPYALNSLDEVERQRFERHLASCDTCRDDVSGYRFAVEELALAAAEAPPAGMRSRVMEEVGRTRQVSTQPARSRWLRPGVGRITLVASIVAAIGLGATTLQQQGRLRRAEAAATLVAAPDIRMVPLSGEGNGRFMYSPSVGSAMFLVDGLSANQRGRTYQLWIIESGTPRGVGTFDADGNRHGELRLKSIPPAGSVLAVTEEPDGGSPLPTSRPVLASEPV